MPEEKAVDEAVTAIHAALEQAEFELAKLGPGLQFLVGHNGEIEIVRRTQTGETVRPKVVIAELRGCDPMLWRLDTAKWLKIETDWMSTKPPVDRSTGEIKARSAVPAERNGGNKPS